MVSGPGKIGRRSLGWEGFRVRVWTRFECREEEMGSGVPVRCGRMQAGRPDDARERRAEMLTETTSDQLTL